MRVRFSYVFSTGTISVSFKYANDSRTFLELEQIPYVLSPCTILVRFKYA